MKPITAKDIARIAGVSRSTVTGVVNDYPFIAEKTKKKVRAIIEEYGYVPNVAARGLVGKRSPVLGLFIVEHTGLQNSQYLGNFMIEIAQSTEKHGFSVLTSLIENDESRIMQLLSEGSIQGAIIIGGAADLTNFTGLLQSDHPAVFVEKGIALKDIKIGKQKLFLTIENEIAAYNATTYLIQKGHKNIVHITGKMDRFTSIERYKGFCRAMNDHGLPVHNDMVLHGDFSAITSRTLFLTYLEKHPSPSAVFAFNDMTALGVIQACKQHGILIPGELSIMGFDDIAIAQEFDPPLTTNRPEKESLAEAAVSNIIEALAENKELPLYLKLTSAIIERNSVQDIS